MLKDKLLNIIQQGHSVVLVGKSSLNVAAGLKLPFAVYRFDTLDPDIDRQFVAVSESEITKMSAMSIRDKLHAMKATPNLWVAHCFNNSVIGLSEYQKE